MQAYANDSDAAVEAKYVFPLDDSAAVCGFEAFINGKHVVGKVSNHDPISSLKNYRKSHGHLLYANRTTVLSVKMSTKENATFIVLI